MKRLRTFAQRSSDHSSTFQKVAKYNVSDTSLSKNEEEHKDTFSETRREIEEDPEVLSRRQKQIDYAKNSLCYERYLKIIPKHKRTKNHPKTPPKHLKMSRRTWDGLIKNWRLKLHAWDPPSDTSDDFNKDNIKKYTIDDSSKSNFDISVRTSPGEKD